MTPLLTGTLARMTFASLIETSVPDMETVKLSPLRATAVIPSDKSVDITLPSTT